MNNISKKQIIAVVTLMILMIAIPVGVYLVQKTQIFKSKASSNPLLNALEIKDANGNVINCDTSTNPPTCETSTSDVTIRIKGFRSTRKMTQ